MILELPGPNFIPNGKESVYGNRGFPGGSDGKESACTVGDPGSNLELGRSPGVGNGNLLQYSCLDKSMDIRAWQTILHGVAKSWTGLSTQT